MKKLSGLAYVYIVIMVIMLVVIIFSLTMPRLSSKLLPIIIGGLVLVLTAFALRQELTRAMPEAAATAEQKDEGKKSGGDLKGYLLNGTWLAGFALGIYTLGFLISMPVFVLAYMRWLGTRWRTAGIFAIVTSALIYGIFEQGLDIELHRGWLLVWLGY
ncbi:MAG: tripartite tricarboxylate transporter TctB family protein [Chloroflexota bacterium]